ncbi:MAG: hypothetical protein ACRDRI_13565 [Pseudonocardiaceae bacterium]
MTADVAEAAQLVESALPDATSGTALLRLASRQARIHAARRQPGDVTRALALAATSTMTALRDDLTEFCTHPAATQPGLEPDSTT